MHFQITGQRMIAGGYQILTASGWGNTAEEAKRNALESHPERNAWSVDELTATPDPISLGSSKVEPTLYRGQVAGSTPALATAFDPVAQMEERRPSMSHVPSSSLGGVTTFPTVACVLLTSAIMVLSSVCADGGESISPRTMGLGQTTGPAWDSGGAADPSPRRATGSARGESISAGAGVVSGQSAARFESSATNTGPADSISVASGTDRKRPHESKPWLSPDLLGAQSERAVSMLGGSSSPLTSPTENSFPTPNLGFTRGFAATGLHSSAGVGNSSSFQRIFTSAFALATVVLTAFTGLAVLCASAASGRLEDR